MGTIAIFSDLGKNISTLQDIVLCASTYVYGRVRLYLVTPFVAMSTYYYVWKIRTGLQRMPKEQCVAHCQECLPLVVHTHRILRAMLDHAHGVAPFLKYLITKQEALIAEVLGSRARRA